jgi:ATP-dependent DNA helicase RecG
MGRLFFMLKDRNCVAFILFYSVHSHAIGQTRSFLRQPIDTIKGIGPFSVKRLKSIGLTTIFDLLCHLPTHYDTFVTGTVRIGCPCYVRIRVKTVRRHKRSLVVQGHGDCGTAVDVVFFAHLPFVIKEQTFIWVKGMVSLNKGTVQMAHPKFAKPLCDTSESSSLLTPVYPLVQGITSAKIGYWVQRALDMWPVYDDSVPCDTGFGAWKHCLTTLHFPTTQTKCQKSLAILAFDEMMAMHLAAIQEQKQCVRHTQACVPVADTRGPEKRSVDAILNRAGYALTESQDSAWFDIQKDMAQTQAMMRLINGDVGSGKTVVAFLAMAQAVDAGFQACLMAPTETLAYQHYGSLSALLPEYDVHLWTSRQSKKKHTFDRPCFVVGTHALFYDNGVFDKLGLVVIDEQQRFGVMQRLRLSDKGQSPHMLFLSATPIPRTFQRIAYYGMDVSYLNKRPRAVPTTSYVVSIDKMDDMIRWCQNKLAANEGIYWVCPSIDDPDTGVVARQGYFDALFPGKVGLLHGRLSSQDKGRVMDDFRSAEKPFLVSTTVIEVGVHVPYATTIFIEHSGQFGLSQLHQLRGRVGRDHLPGHCFFVYHPPLMGASKQRLHYVKTCHDGFELARFDWSARGAGMVMGTLQSGHRRTRFFCPDHHEGFIDKARAMAETSLSPDHGALLMDVFGYHGGHVLHAG